MDSIHILLRIFAVDIRIHGIVSSQAQSIWTFGRVEAVTNVPGVDITFNVPGQYPVLIQGNAANLETKFRV